VRNRYLDLLRAAAIVRVIVYHLFGWPWLSILLPAMGIMFALAGSLTAASLDKRAAGQVITSRLRRLLPPLWVLAVIAVPAMLYLGWTREHDGDEPLSWKLALWLLPIGDPPGSQRGIDVWEPLWYVRAYLWFVVLSPLLYRAYKKIGWGAVAAPVVLLAVLDKTDLTLPLGRADAAMWDFVTYGACWIAGFAHHDGRLARIRPGLVVAASAVLGLVALYWLRGHAGEAGWDLNDVAESQALWSLAFVLLALRWQPNMDWLQRSPRLDGAVNLLNARAVTIYLWHNIAIAAIWPVLTVLALDDLEGLDGPTDLIASLVLTVGAVLAFGWVEDLAARRKPALWPTGRTRRDSDPPSPESAGGFGSAADLGSRPTGDLRPGAQQSARSMRSSRFVALDAVQPPGAPPRVVTPRQSVPPRVDGEAPWAGGGVSGGAPWAGGGVGGGATPAPWAGAAAAPIVVGQSGRAARQQDYVAPFPEAAVSFGFPDNGPELGRNRRPASGEAARDVGGTPAATSGSPVSAPPTSGPPTSGPPTAGPPTAWPPTSAAVEPVQPVRPAAPTGPTPSTGPTAPIGPAGTPAQTQRHDHGDEDHGPAVPWFGGEGEPPRRDR
jgi:hypothetical protein